MGSSTRAPHLLGAIVTKALQFLLLLIVLTIVEEVLVGLHHGSSIGQTMAGFEQHSVVQMLAKCLLALLILLPLIAIKELSRTLGPGVLQNLLLKSAPAPADPGSLLPRRPRGGPASCYLSGCLSN